MITSIFRKLIQTLRHSRRLHLRERGVANASDLVGLIDRFRTDELKYELEWDDFISWSNANPTVEEARNRIANLEPLFFSKEQKRRAKAVALLIEERNRLASLCGMEILIPP